MFGGAEQQYSKAVVRDFSGLRALTSKTEEPVQNHLLGASVTPICVDVAMMLR